MQLRPTVANVPVNRWSYAQLGNQAGIIGAALLEQV